MNKNVLSICVSVVFLFTLVSSVRADSVRLPLGLDKLNLVQGQTLDLAETHRVDLRSLLTEHFANNNGRHQGFSRLLADDFANNSGRHQAFSVAAVRGGVKFGLANPRHPGASVTQNPEPTGMLLLGTGLAAAAAFARRRARRRNRPVDER